MSMSYVSIVLSSTLFHVMYFVLSFPQVGYEFLFPIHSPLITRIQVLKRGFIGRNKNACAVASYTALHLASQGVLGSSASFYILINLITGKAKSRFWGTSSAEHEATHNIKPLLLQDFFFCHSKLKVEGWVAQERSGRMKQ